LTKSSFISFNWSIKQDVALEIDRIEYPLDMHMTMVEDEDGDSSSKMRDLHNVRSLDDTFHDNVHLTGSKKEKESKTKTEQRDKSQHQPFERYVFHMLALSVIQNDVSCP